VSTIMTIATTSKSFGQETLDIKITNTNLELDSRIFVQ
jgi:hypothetical protein